MSSINTVLDGKYKNQDIRAGKEISTKDSQFMSGFCFFNKKTITSYIVIDETNKDQFSFGKAALGVAVFGGIGAIAGIKGKNKKEYLVAIEWKDGEKSLIYIDDDCYKTLVKSMF